jgi:peptidoglycan hydrolase-like protein with peptidoglycan-binding domain
VVTAGLLTPSTADADPSAPPITLPAHPRGLVGPVTLPDDLDPASPYLPQVSCSPIDMPGVIKLRDLVLKTYGEGGKGAIHHGCTEGVSEHSEGRAWDWMASTTDKQQKAAAADFISWVTRNKGENARRLGIMYVIYNKKIWSIYREGEGWRPSNDHVDHVHISFSWNGARGNTSFWTGKVGVIDKGPCVRFTGTYAARTNTPRQGLCRPTSALLKKTSLGQRAYGSTGPTVAKGQALLGVKKTSTFDAATWTVVKNYQVAHDIPRTGVLDQPTWASLSPTSVTTRVVKGYTQSEAAAYGLDHYANTTVRSSDVSKSVMFLQIALHLAVDDRNGYFGAVTLAAVKAMQTRAGLEPSGVVGTAEWQALVRH